MATGGGSPNLKSEVLFNSQVVKPKHKEANEFDMAQWLCKICQKVFSDPKSKVMECEYCEQRYCIKCLKMPAREYDLLKSSSAMWFCGPCKSKVAQNIATEKVIEEKCAVYLREFTERLEKVERLNETKCDEVKVRQIVREEIDKENKEAGPKKKGTDETDAVKVESSEYTIRELNDRREREPNLIIFNAAEPKTNLKAERENKDKTLFVEICEQCESNITDTDVTKVIRLGTKRTEGKPRPLLIALANKDLKRDLFRNLSKLKGSDYEDIRIVHDMTKREREETIKEMYETAKKMEAESQGKYKYRVRGPPWGKKIIKIKGTLDDQ